MVDKNLWLVGFENLELEKKLYLLLCFEAKTGKIQTFAISFQKITIQNVTRKLEDAIQRNNKPLTLCLKDDSYLVSKTYKNFLKNVSYLVDSEKGTEKQTEKIQTFFREFLEFLVEGKTFQESLFKYQNLNLKKDINVVNDFIEKWNETKIDIGNPQKETNQKLLEEITKVKARYAEVVASTPFDFRLDERTNLEVIPKEMEKLSKLLKEGHYSLTNLVEKKINAVSQQLNEVEKKVSEISGDVKQLLPTEKQKHVPKPLRDPVSEEIFELLVFNAGSLYSYQKETRQAQFQIAYTILYFLGLRVNELRQIKLTDILKLLEGEDLKIILHKTNRSHTCRLSLEGIEKLKELKPKIDFLIDTKKFQYLFGKEEALERKTLIRTMNEDIRATCQLCKIPGTITSHSFRISMVSRLLKVTRVEHVAEIMGHTDIRTTMLYNRYRLTKSKILKIYSQAEEANHNWED